MTTTATFDIHDALEAAEEKRHQASEKLWDLNKEYRLSQPAMPLSEYAAWKAQTKLAGADYAKADQEYNRLQELYENDQNI